MSEIKDGLAIVPFANKDEMHAWFREYHQSSPGIWLKMYKKASGVPSIVWAEAVEVCLCWGWIDGIANKYDESSYLQRLTPRRSRSTWSKKNVETVARLIDEGLMQPSGLAQVEAAKADGRWERAYESPANMTVPDDFVAALEKYPAAKATFQTLGKTSKYFIGYQLTTAKKPETRDRRFQVIIDKLSRGEKI